MTHDRTEKGVPMPDFSIAETNLICLYYKHNRLALINELKGMCSYLTANENELRMLTESVITKLESMTDNEYNTLEKALQPTIS